MRVPAVVFKVDLEAGGKAKVEHILDLAGHKAHPYIPPVVAEDEHAAAPYGLGRHAPSEHLQ
eukprot:scaffold95998_cov27-Tisochrysis_lutea.AAC.2